MKTLGIDLGTNSIGLAIKENNEFTWFGVYTFKKGVGMSKSGEFSFAAERTSHRSTRRLYNARKYRKWETLKILIEDGYCPLTIEELNKWKRYEKGIGRTFPINNKYFNSWIKLDFNSNGIQDYRSPYQLRKELINDSYDLSNKENKFKIGRAFYHIAQRRGFKSSRKNGVNEKTAVYKGSNETNTIGRDKYEELIKSKGSLGSAFAYLEGENIRIRNRYTLRKDYLNEVEKIIKIQHLDINFSERIKKAIFYQRPLRSQKGLIGKCTLEVNKHRCPISHPKYESFRAWSFINTLKYKTLDTNSFIVIPFALKTKIYNEIFLKDRKQNNNFKFSQIRNFIEKNGGKEWQLNYKKKLDDTNVSGCPISARLKSVFGLDWNNINIKTDNTRITKKGELVKIKYSIEDIWHILFSYEDEELFEEFITNKLKLNEEHIKSLKSLWNSFPIGYGNLSLQAINNILPFLKEGLIYTEAVLLAKIPSIIGNTLFEKNKEIILSEIKSKILKNRELKTKLSIVNLLISNHYSDNIGRHAKGIDSYIKEQAQKDVMKTLPNYFGSKKWAGIFDIEKQNYYNFVFEKYLKFLDGKQEKTEKASYSKRNNPETDYYKMPHLLNQIKDFLISNFNISDTKLKCIYHPSQINIYPKENNQIYLNSPKTAAFKNPMAYKTLYHLKEVINHLIKIEKIDYETKIVVEIARGLNDSNKRKAIEIYQRQRERENEEFAIAITELTKDHEFFGSADPKNKVDKNKFRLWTEQLENKDELLKQITATKDDVEKYRFWKEQNCQCMYTGKTINITDLFNPNTIDFEHTIPRSKSFDNSLANLTVCYANYNRSIKNNKIPTELPNFKNEYGEFSAIEPRIEKWKKRIEKLEKQIDICKFKSRIAINKEDKDKAIIEKHLRYFEFEYWKNKVDRFTREDIPQGFKNSQLIDTQIISKYAFHYLKTIFSKVDVQKGEVTAQFRKIYNIQEKNNKKNRAKHHHHAIDAAVLTLIPDSTKREDILKKSYDYSEANSYKQYHAMPFKGFKQTLITDIEKTILINNIANKDQALTIGKKKVRNRGKITFLKDKNGKNILNQNNQKIIKIAQGDSIRGQLHEETFYGKIRLPKYNSKGTLLRDNDGNIVLSNEYWTVKREIITDLIISNKKIKNEIIDIKLKEHIEKQISNGSQLNNIFDFNNKVIRHIRTRAKAGRGYLLSENLIKLKPHTYASKHRHKQDYFVKTGDNYAFALYLANDGKKKIISRNLFETSQFVDKSIINSINDLFEKTIMITKTKEARLYHVFQIEQKVIFYENNKDELKDLDNLSDRLYFVKVLSDAKQELIKFQHHIDARNDEQLLIDFPKETFGSKGKNGFSKFLLDFVQPRLLLSPNNLNCIIENKDFKMTLDGSIIFLF